MNLRAEHELLVCMARKSLDECTSDRLRNLTQQNIDWGYLLQIAARLGHLPLLQTTFQAIALADRITLIKLNPVFIHN